MEELINDVCGIVLMHSISRFISISIIALIFTVALIANAPVSGTVVEQANDPLQISNDEVKNS